MLQDASADAGSDVLVAPDSPDDGDDGALDAPVVEDARDAADAAPLDTGTDAGCVGSLVINEVRTYGPAPVLDTLDEFVELYNAGGCDQSLVGWTIAGRDGSHSPATMIWTGTSANHVAGHAYFVVGGSDFSGTPDSHFMANSRGALSAVSQDGALGLYDPTGALVDAVAYGGQTTTDALMQGDAASDPGSGDRSIGRFPDGTDSHRNSVDFSLMPASPGAANHF